MRIDVWADVVCPWCYVGKRHLEAALAVYEHAAEVEVVWRSFELDPGAPRRRDGTYAGHLARKYGVAPEQAQAMIDRMTATAAKAGIDMRFDLAQPGNTFDAHRLLHLAREHGCQPALEERLLRATFTEGRPIADVDTLAELAGDVGLPAAAVEQVLGSDAYAEAVRADEREAAELGATGVPFFVIDGRFGIGGAQPPETLLRFLRRLAAA